MRLALGGPAVALSHGGRSTRAAPAPRSWYPGALLFLARSRRWPTPSSLAAARVRRSWRSPRWSPSRLELPLDHVGGRPRRRVGRRQSHAALPAGLRALRAVPWTAVEASILLGAFALATALVGAWAVGATLAGNAGSFRDGRLAAPIGYENASAALLLAAFWPAVLLASARSTPAPRARAAAGDGGAAARARRAVPEPGLADRRSARRSWSRLRSCASAAGCSGARRRWPRRRCPIAAPARGLCRRARARRALGAGAAIALAALDGAARGRLGARGRPAASRSLAAALAVAGRGAAVAGAPAGRASPAGWNPAAMTSGASPGASSRATRSPGAGADNFAQDYARERRGREEPLYPHSIVLRTLGQTGHRGSRVAHRVPRSGVRRYPLDRCRSGARRPWLR